MSFWSPLSLWARILLSHIVFVGTYLSKNIFANAYSRDLWERESEDPFPPYLPFNPRWWDDISTLRQQKQKEVRAEVGLSSSFVSLPGAKPLPWFPFPIPGLATWTPSPGSRVTSSPSPSLTSGWGRQRWSTGGTWPPLTQPSPSGRSAGAQQGWATQAGWSSSGSWPRQNGFLCLRCGLVLSRWICHNFALFWTELYSFKLILSWLDQHGMYHEQYSGSLYNFCSN